MRREGARDPAVLRGARMTTVLLVDDHPLVRGLSGLLASADGIDVVGAAETATRASAWSASSSPTSC